MEGTFMKKIASIYVILLILSVPNARANDAGTLPVEPWYEGRTPDTLYASMGPPALSSTR
jgi:hypothetical protein